jgi:hypothetical protein
MNDGFVIGPMPFDIGPHLLSAMKNFSKQLLTGTSRANQDCHAANAAAFRSIVAER